MSSLSLTDDFSRSRRAVRETSIKAYRELQKSGKLSESRLEAFRIIAEYPGATAREIDVIGGKANEPLSRSFQPQIHYLVKVGLVEETGTGICNITKRMCITYQCTGATDITQVKKSRFTREQKSQALDALIGTWSKFSNGNQAKLEPLVLWLKKEVGE